MSRRMWDLDMTHVAAQFEGEPVADPTQQPESGRCGRCRMRATFTIDSGDPESVPLSECCRWPARDIEPMERD